MEEDEEQASESPVWQEPEAANQAAVQDETDTGHFRASGDGLGLDGSTPEGGIQGRLTHAGSNRESERNDRDWQVHVDVDQPVQSSDDE